ncbi:MAG: hypothetical protein DIU78_002035 [Pseudomonadota bacterium]
MSPALRWFLLIVLAAVAASCTLDPQPILPGQPPDASASGGQTGGVNEGSDEGEAGAAGAGGGADSEEP